jgi:hypothetical protein
MRRFAAATEAKHGALPHRRVRDSALDRDGLGMLSTAEHMARAEREDSKIARLDPCRLRAVDRQPCRAAFDDMEMRDRFAEAKRLRGGLFVGANQFALHPHEGEYVRHGVRVAIDRRHSRIPGSHWGDARSRNPDILSSKGRDNLIHNQVR